MRVSIRNNKHGCAADPNQSEGENKYTLEHTEMLICSLRPLLFYVCSFLSIHSFGERARAAQNTHTRTIETGVKPNENEMERNSA